MTKSYLRAGIIISLLTLFLLGNLLPAQAEGSRPVAQSWVWVNPMNAGESIEHPTMVRTLAATSSSTANNLQELKSILRTGLENRQTPINILYTGSESDLNKGLDSGAAGLTEIYESLLAEDDYLKYNTGSAELGYQGPNVGPFNVFFTVVYRTTLEQENYVNEQVATILSTIIIPGMNEHQKEKAIHDYIVKNVAYDESLSDTSHSAYAALYNKKAVCQGYALLAHKMLSEAGVSVRCVVGTGHGENHLWNLVCLDDKWYHLDCTWDDPAPDTPGKIRYNYYNLSDQEMAADHIWTAGDYPACSSSYYHELNNKLGSDTNNQALWQSLLIETELYLLSPEKTAENAAALEEKIHNSMLLYEPALKLRFNSAGADPGSLLDSVLNSALTDTDCSDCSCQYSNYNRGGQNGYYLLEFTFTYHNNTGNANLSSLTLSSGTLGPAFDPGITSYSVNVDNTVSSISITPTAAAAQAAIKVNGSPVSSGSLSQAIALNPGNNTIIILITAQNAAARTYTITINRAFPLPSVVWTPWKEEKTVSQNHPYWTITFSQDVDDSTVNSQNIFVGIDPEGTTPLPGVSVPQLVTAKQIRLSPPSGSEHWSPGTYYLFIRPDVESTGNKTLGKGIRMKFTVQ